MTTASERKRCVQTRLPAVATRGANSANTASQEDSQVTDINGLFAEIAKVGATLNGVASDVTLIKSDTTELKKSVSAIKTRLTEAERRISDVEDTVANLARNNVKLTKAVEQLYERVDDQENRARRKNIRLVGLKEGKEAGMPLANYVQKILCDGLELNGGDYEIERCHRSSGPRPDPNQPPRIILVRFLKYTAREKVLAAAKKKKGILWDGCRLSLFEDMTKERSARRRMFSTVMKRLWQQQVKHTLAHPAILRFTWRGKRLSFTDAKEAESFVREHIESAEDGGTTTGRQIAGDGEGASADINE